MQKCKKEKNQKSMNLCGLELFSCKWLFIVVVKRTLLITLKIGRFFCFFCSLG